MTPYYPLRLASERPVSVWAIAASLAALLGSLIALALAVIGLYGSLPTAVLLVMAALGQLLWYRLGPVAAQALLWPALGLLTLCLVSYLLPEHWLPHAAWDRLADRLLTGSLLVDWRPPLLLTLCLIALLLSLAVRTRAGLGAPMLLGIAGLLLLAQAAEAFHSAPALLSLRGSWLDQAILLTLLAGQMVDVAGAWQQHAFRLRRALWPALCLALLSLLFWHHQKALGERELAERIGQQHAQMAESLSREIHDHLAAMRRFANVWRLTAATPGSTDWATQAAPYQRDFRYFLNIAYIDAATRIQLVHPPNAHNLRILGSRLLEDQPAGREAVISALQHGREARTDIIELLQGGPGVIHYLPLFLAHESHPRGAVAMVVSLPVLAETLFTAIDPGTQQLSLFHGGERLAHQSAEARLGPWQLEAELDLSGIPLVLRAEPTLPRLLGDLPRQPVVSLSVGLLLAQLLYLVLFSQQEMANQHRAVRRTNHELRREIRKRTRLQQEVEWLAGHDELTGLPNRRTFLQALRAHDPRQPISVLLCDIDHFKRINDRLGHLEGDRYLIEIGRLGREVIEPAGGLFARLGGEEFVACLPGREGPEAMRVADTLREAVAARGLTHADGTPLTISIGVATGAPGPLGVDDLLNAADMALYRAKGAGRNRARLADSLAAPGGEELP
ncbi:GGDEF domain-containing protein [Halomonas alkalicola]|uniref:GGDEF domain-containing protein n=1 Tax=Halomonas alkalicola TaxID=1930622 RepID=UPI00265DD9D0|nr:sensor domain-containing diguanylate cyclase [Halomonas alkalicola]